MLTKLKESWRSKRGFTLIELLVVVAIIGLLATIVALSLNSARSRARDARRVSDIRQIEAAMELYFANNKQSYPKSLEELVDGGYLAVKSEPTDPRGSFSYCYAFYIDSAFSPPNNVKGYHVGAVLENATSDFLEGKFGKKSAGVAGWAKSNDTGGTDGVAYNPMTECAGDGFDASSATGSDAIYDRGVFPTP